MTKDTQKSDPVLILPLIGHIVPGTTVYIRRHSVHVHCGKYYINKAEPYYDRKIGDYNIELRINEDGYHYIYDALGLNEQPKYHHSYFTPSNKQYAGPFEFSDKPICYLVHYKHIIIYMDLIEKFNESVKKNQIDKIEHYCSDIIDLLKNQLMSNNVHWYYANYVSQRSNIKFREVLFDLTKKKIKEYFTNFISGNIWFFRKTWTSLWIWNGWNRYAKY